jgi:hypothetical protein
MSLVFAAGPPAPPPPAISPWRGLTHTLTGSNGDSVELSDVDTGIVLYYADVSGLHMPKYEVYRSGGPAVAGSRYRGTRALERPVDLTILVVDDESTEGFLDTDRRVWDLIGDPSLPVVWRVQTPDGDARELTMRYADSDDAFARDPLFDGWVAYQISFIADDPYWYGPAVTKTWDAAEAQDFFIAAPAPGDLFYISKALTTDTVIIENTGDVDAWVTWTADGELSNLDFTMIAEGMTNGALGLPDVADGDTLVTNTDPRVATATLTSPPADPTDITGQVDPWDPRPVPRHGTQTLQVAVAIAGDGSLAATIRPRYKRAW